MALTAKVWKVDDADAYFYNEKSSISVIVTADMDAYLFVALAAFVEQKLMVVIPSSESSSNIHFRTVINARKSREGVVMKCLPKTLCGVDDDNYQYLFFIYFLFIFYFLFFL